MMDNLRSIVKKFDSNLWQYHIPIPDDIASKYIEGDNKRVVCTINQELKMHAAIMKSAEYYFILINSTILKKLQLEEDSSMQMVIEKDRSEYGMPLPEEMEAVFHQDEQGYEYFKALTMGKQRSLVYIVSKVKNVQSRINKSLAIMHHLNEVRGKLDFKQLNETIKYFNNLNK